MNGKNRIKYIKDSFWKFDFSEEEGYSYLIANRCPSDFGMIDRCAENQTIETCKRCWKVALEEEY